MPPVRAALVSVVVVALTGSFFTPCLGATPPPHPAHGLSAPLPAHGFSPGVPAGPLSGDWLTVYRCGLACCPHLGSNFTAIGPATPQYNCIAHTLGIHWKWII